MVPCLDWDNHGWTNKDIRAILSSVSSFNKLPVIPGIARQKEKQNFP